MEFVIFCEVSEKKLIYILNKVKLNNVCGQIDYQEFHKKIDLFGLFL